MNRDEILDMKPGRELDCLVAEKVMNKRVHFIRPWGWLYAEQDVNRWTNVKHYSTDIAAAWEVRQRIHETIGGTKISSVCDEFPEECQIWDGRSYISVRSNTVPEAICRAALLAVLGGVRE